MRVRRPAQAEGGRLTSGKRTSLSGDTRKFAGFQGAALPQRDPWARSGCATAARRAFHEQRPEWPPGPAGGFAPDWLADSLIAAESWTRAAEAERDFDHDARQRHSAVARRAKLHDVEGRCAASGPISAKLRHNHNNCTPCMRASVDLLADDASFVSMFPRRRLARQSRAERRR